ncbi:MAG: tryptophan synthase subunit alpha [Candidatus Omnitrophota bacterium]
MNRIDKKFEELRRVNKKAFIVFITAGYPNLSTTEKLILEFAKRGVDIIELGVPFSDPLADGPIIQEASQKALEKNVHLIDILRLVKKVRKVIDTPLCLMTYYNPVFCFGEKKFIDQALQCGVDGLILPDLTPEEGASFTRYAQKKGLDVIYFLSPTSTPKRMKFISEISRGFIYYVSLTGVTGPRKELPRDVIAKVREIKKLTVKPVCVGFGVSSPQQVRKIQKIADGVIVGSAIVHKIKEHIARPDLIQKVSRFVSYLKT